MTCESFTIVGNPTKAVSVSSFVAIREAERWGAAVRHVAATADRIDYWIRRHVVPCPPQGGVNPAALQRYVGLTAIGRCLKDQYDALASPIPPPLATLEARAEPLRIRVCYLHR
jgi:hypothetical protein